MLKITNAFRWIYGIIFRKPTRFSWLIDGRVALTFSQYRWLLKQGIKTLVTVREEPLSSKWINQNKKVIKLIEENIIYICHNEMVSRSTSLYIHRLSHTGSTGVHMD